MCLCNLCLIEVVCLEMSFFVILSCVIYSLVKILPIKLVSTPLPLFDSLTPSPYICRPRDGACAVCSVIKLMAFQRVRITCTSVFVYDALRFPCIWNCLFTTFLLNMVAIPVVLMTGKLQTEVTQTGVMEVTMVRWRMPTGLRSGMGKELKFFKWLKIVTKQTTSVAAYLHFMMESASYWWSYESDDSTVRESLSGSSWSGWRLFASRSPTVTPLCLRAMQRTAKRLDGVCEYPWKM